MSPAEPLDPGQRHNPETERRERRTRALVGVAGIGGQRASPRKTLRAMAGNVAEGRRPYVPVQPAVSSAKATASYR